MNRRGRVRMRILYWYRTPPNVRVGRDAFDADVRREIEARNPEITFDWDALLATPRPAAPSPDAENWRERRRLLKASRSAAAVEETEETETAVVAGETEDSAVRADTPEPEPMSTSGALGTDPDASTPSRKRRRRRRRGGRKSEQAGTAEPGEAGEAPAGDGDIDEAAETIVTEFDENDGAIELDATSASDPHDVNDPDEAAAERPTGSDSTLAVGETLEDPKDDQAEAEEHGGTSEAPAGGSDDHSSPKPV